MLKKNANMLKKRNNMGVRIESQVNLVVYNHLQMKQQK